MFLCAPLCLWGEWIRFGQTINGFFFTSWMPMHLMDTPGFDVSVVGE